MKADLKNFDIRNYVDTETAPTIDNFLNNGDTLSSITKK